MPKLARDRPRDVEIAIVARLRDEMDRRDWSIASLLAALEEAGYPMHRTTLKRLLDGEKTITVDDAAALAAAFGVDVATLIEPPTARNDTLFARALLGGAGAEKACAEAEKRLAEAKQALERAELLRMKMVTDAAVFLTDTSLGSDGEANGDRRQAFLRQGATRLKLPVSEQLRVFVQRVLDEYEEYDGAGMDLNEMWMDRSDASELDPFGMFAVYAATEKEQGR